MEVDEIKIAHVLMNTTLHYHGIKFCVNITAKQIVLKELIKSFM